MVLMEQQTPVNWGDIANKLSDGGIITVSIQEMDNIVVLSEQLFKELEKAKRNQEYFAKIDRAIEQRKMGTMKEHALIEV